MADDANTERPDAAAEATPTSQPTSAPPPWWQPPKKKSWVRRILHGMLVLVLISSIVLNAYLLLLLSMSFGPSFSTVVLQDGRDDQIIAVYNVTGMIDGEAAASFTGFANEVRKDKNVKAVLLRVDSPGGGVGASDQMHDQVRRLRKAGKPVVVSMGGMAASGGYYISADADEIFAEPLTITGSIGVIIAWPVLEKTLDHIGVEMQVIKSSHSTDWKDDISAFRKPNLKQLEHVQNLADEIQARFEQMVLEGRGEKVAKVLATQPAPRDVVTTQGARPRAAGKAPFNGKVYLAAQAKQLGLIDRIGFQQDALDRTQELAGLDKPKVVRYRPRRGLLAALLIPHSSAGIQLDAKTLDELQTPRVQLLWKIQ